VLRLDWNPSLAAKFPNSPASEESAGIVGALVIAPIASVVKAEETTVIKPDRDGDRDKTIIKEREGSDRTVIEKREELNVLPVPHTEEKTIIKKERD
jgi:hypothetical protein